MRAHTSIWGHHETLVEVNQRTVAFLLILIFADVVHRNGLWSV